MLCVPTRGPLTDKLGLRHALVDMHLSTAVMAFDSVAEHALEPGLTTQVGHDSVPDRIAGGSATQAERLAAAADGSDICDTPQSAHRATLRVVTHLSRRAAHG